VFFVERDQLDVVFNGGGCEQGIYDIRVVTFPIFVAQGPSKNRNLLVHG